MRLFEFNKNPGIDRSNVNVNLHNDALAKTLKEHCLVALEAYTFGDKIYKGIDVEYESLSIDPNLYTRQSANTSNFYTMLLDNLPSWKNYPKRSKSIICTNSKQRANSYGTVYSIFPFDGAKIGVCPADDIWYSFTFGHITALNEILDHFDIYPSNYGAMLNSILEHADEIGEGIDSVIDHFTNGNENKFVTYKYSEILHISIDVLEQFSFLYTSNTQQDLIRSFDELLNPKTNGFRIATINDIPDDFNSHELWTDSECIAIRIDNPILKRIEAGEI